MNKTTQWESSSKDTKQFPWYCLCDFETTLELGPEGVCRSIWSYWFFLAVSFFFARIAFKLEHPPLIFDQCVLLKRLVKLPIKRFELLTTVDVHVAKNSPV